MIDLSHLTDEEQEAILTVLKRDEDLKKAEEDRIRTLQKKVSPMQSKLKYLTGEWFYEAKSQRHNDKIHGSEIILASMKQKRADTLEGSLSRSRAVSGRGSDIVAPPKPARLLETPIQPQQTRESSSVADTERARIDVNVRSPGMPRHNPFNQASIVLELSEKTEIQLANGNQEPVKPTEAAPVSPLKTSCLSSQTSTGSVTSEGSSVGFRPVPKKRTFLSRRPSALSDSDISLSGPAPQRGSGVMTSQGSLQHGSTCSSSLGGGTIPSISESQNNPSSHAGNSLVLVSYKQLTDAALVSVEPSLERAAKPQSNTYQRVVETSQGDSFRMSQGRSPSPAFRSENVLLSLTGPQTPTNLQPALLPDSDRNTERFISRGQMTDRRDGLTQREYVVGHLSGMETSVLSEHQSSLLSDVTKPAPIPIPQPSGQQNSTYKPAAVEAEKTLVEEETHARNAGTHVDLNQPYDLHVSDDKPKKQSPKKPSCKTAFKSAPRSPKTTGEEGKAIAKVLDWFSRSTDSNDWLETESGQPEVLSIDREENMTMEDLIEPVRNYSENISETKYQLREKTSPRMMRDHQQEYTGIHEPFMGQSVYSRPDKTSEDGLKSKPTEVHSPVNMNRTYQFKRRISETETAGRRERKDMSEKEEEELGKVTQQVKPQVTQVKEEVQDENQSANISNLKSFWEKGNVGPKILISRSNTGVEIRPRPGNQETEKKNDKEEKAVLDKVVVPPEENAPHLRSGKEIQKTTQDMKHKVSPPTVGIQMSPSPRDYHPSAGAQNREDRHLTSPTNPLVWDRRGSETEILSLNRLSFQPELQARPPPELQADPLPPSRASPQPGNLSPAAQVLSSPQPETLQVRDIPEGDQPTHSSHMEYHSGGIGREQVSPQTKTKSSAGGNFKEKEKEERDVQSPRKQDDLTFTDRGNILHTPKQPPPRNESTAEKVRQLKSFWEKEKTRPVIGKSKELGDVRLYKAPSKLNKRFTKSEYDLLSIGNGSESDNEGDSVLSSDRINFTVLTMNQRLDKLSPSLGGNRSQFKNLRDFWGEAISNRKGPSAFDKPRSLKKNETADSLHPMLELKQCVDPEFYSTTSPTHTEKVSARPPVDESWHSKSSPSPPPSLARGNKEREHQLRSPTDRQIGLGTGALIDSQSNLSSPITLFSEQQKCPWPQQGRRGSDQKSSREEKPPRPQGTLAKESHSPKTRKDSFGNSSGRSTMRRARSMFSLDVDDQQDKLDKPYPGQVRKTREVSPVQGKTTQARRQSADKEAGPRRSSRSSEESESLALRARSFVPRDYRHYLGISEKSSAHSSMVPALKDFDSRAGVDLDLSGPVQSSTPTGSEESYGRRGSKTAQRPPWSNQGSTDTGRESSLSSTSESWSNSRSSSKRENGEEDQNPVKRALRRAEARPKNLAKSLEDITASLPQPSSFASPSSSTFSDPEHLKKLSKSVPSFLQKENDGRDTDSTSENSYHGSRQMTGRSMTNLSTSSGMASVSSMSGSVMTMYSGDFENVEVQGNIQFSINYVQKLREFHIFVAQCQDLAAVDPKRGRSDPYVKSYLVPDKANLGKRKTSVKKKTQNPTFNEILRYRVRLENLRTQTLILSVWHHDTFGRNSFLGEVDVDLSKWDFDHTQMNYLALKARPTTCLKQSDDRGEMRLAIRFLPQIAHSVAKEGPITGEVHIWVKDCKNLPLIRGASIDPYVKCFVLPDTSRKSRQKTRVLRRTVEPVFNHTMVYDGFRQEDLKEACVELTVWDRDRLASNLLGGLRLGPGTGRSYGAVVDWMDSTPSEVALWERMMESPNEWVEGVLALRMLTTAKTALK
ncbi:uncharacterized protein sytl2b isoform X2 [Osmerus mordax]|uniref:uncharacterized protein sytl2b isoform X2 n=1 Tax=Osmerus mordax TaxID=8014 RepID=UPI00350F62C9